MSKQKKPRKVQINTLKFETIGGKTIKPYIWIGFINGLNANYVGFIEEKEADKLLKLLKNFKKYSKQTKKRN